MQCLSVFKKTLKAFAFLVTTIFILAQLLNWAKNPYGLEAERLAPKDNEKFQPIRRVDNAKNYLLLSEYTKNSYAIHLPIPNSYIHPSNVSSKLIASYAVGVRMYFPEMEGGFQEKNNPLLTCYGYCKGYVFAYITADTRRAKTKNHKRFEFINEDKAKKSAFYRFESLGKEFGLDDHFQIRYPLDELKNERGKSSTKEYIFKRNKSGEIQYLFECHPYVPSPSCSVDFNLSSQPDLLVNLSFGRHLMENWQEVIAAADHKIASWHPARIEVAQKERY